MAYFQAMGFQLADMELEERRAAEERQDEYANVKAPSFDFEKASNYHSVYQIC